MPIEALVRVLDVDHGQINLEALAAPAPPKATIHPPAGVDPVAGAPTAVAAIVPTAKEVQGMKVAELKAECAKRNISTGGLKKDLAERLLALQTVTKGGV